MDKVEEAANKVVDAHKALIESVTPGHPNSRLDDRDIESLFSAWHATTRELRDALGRTGEYV